MDDKRRTVTLVYRMLPHYRVEFYNGLKKALSEWNIEFNLIYGKNDFVPRQDEVDLPWAVPVPIKTFAIGSAAFYWLPVQKKLYDSDLIIIQQENRILSNHLILMESVLRKKRVAFWGHGRNHQAELTSIGNVLKRLYVKQVCWWFAYTKGVAELIVRMGFPADRVSIVYNAIDTRSLSEEYGRIGSQEVIALKNTLGIGPGPIGLFCGGIYKEKRIEFLLESCCEIRRTIPGFEMVFIGEGPESGRIEQCVAKHRWVHQVGAKLGLARVPFFKMADVFLMPGLVGLAILDCFALETPLVTTKYRYHSPEIEYLLDEENGIATEESLDSFVAGVLRVLSDSGLREKLKKGCRAGAARHTVENMIANFREGIKKALCC